MGVDPGGAESSPELQGPGWSLTSRPRLLRAAIVALVVWGPVFSAVLWSQGLRPQAAAVGAGALFLVAVTWLQRTREDTVVTGNLVAGALFGSATLLAWQAEGLLSPALAWYVAVPALATILVGRRSGVAWGALCVAVIVAFFAFDRVEPRLPQAVMQVVVVWGQSGLVIFGLSFALLYDAFRRRSEAAIAAKNRDLERALHEVETLQGILPICMHCRKVRDEHAVWQALEEYLGSRSELRFSHGLCDDCLRKLYLDEADGPARVGERARAERAESPSGDRIRPGREDAPPHPW
jgi:hypothetical protein